MRRTFTFMMAFAALTLVGCKNNAPKEQVEEPMTEEINLTEVQVPENLPEEPIYEIVTNKGTIKIQLFSETPLHRDNFAKLASVGYYDSLLFHRVIADFMIQAGDPTSKNAPREARLGSGGPDYTIPAEFVAEKHHIKGAVAAARRGDAANPTKASSGSQFYIVLSEDGCSHLDGEYTIFGQAIEGLDVIDAIGAVETDGRDRPLEDIVILSVNLCK